MRLFLLSFFLLVLAGCTGALTVPPPAPAVPPTLDPERIEGPHAQIPEAGINPRAEDEVEDYPRYGVTLGFDAIEPIYEPEFEPAEQSRLSADELIIGVAWGGEAKAYPISVLRSRELVEDELAGVPILVSW